MRIAGLIACLIRVLTIRTRSHAGVHGVLDCFSSWQWMSNIKL